MRARTAIGMAAGILVSLFLFYGCWINPNDPDEDGNKPFVDNQPPSVVLTEPADGSTVQGFVTITAQATDNVAVDRVEFFVDGTLPPGASDDTSPYQFLWDTNALADSSIHTIFAKAFDTSLNFSFSDTITVTVDNSAPDAEPPMVSISYPSDGDTISGTITIVADATDNVGILKVEFFIDGAMPADGVEYSYPYEQLWDTSTLPDGSAHTIYAIATDFSDNVSYSDTITVVVDNSVPPPPPLGDSNVIVVMIDGLRYTEGFGDPTHQYIKFMYNYLKPQGVVFTNFRNDGWTKTVPGHAAVATGTWQYLANDGSERPDRPTFFEYLRKQYSVAQNETYVVVGKSKLDACTYSTQSTYGYDYRASSDAVDRDDEATYQALIGHLQNERPRLVLVNLPSVDRAGHNGVWSEYISAVQTADSLVYELWQFIQNDPFYSGKTYMFVTNDHGRHDYDFTGHGDDCEGCTHIMCLTLGPDVRADYTVTGRYTQIDICPTVASIMGFSAPYAQGTAMDEIFEALVFAR